MKKIFLAVGAASFLIFNATGMDNHAAKKQKTEASVSSLTLSEQSSGTDDYETFKAAEHMCEIVEEAIGTMLKKRGVDPLDWLSKEAFWVRNEQIGQTHVGLLTKEFRVFYTPWGLKKMSEDFDSSISKEIRQEGQKKLIADFFSQIADQTIYKVLKVDGKKLPEPVEREDEDCLKIAIVKASLKKHQERYQKEITDEIVPFIPVRAVAEVVTAYLMKKDESVIK